MPVLTVGSTQIPYSIRHSKRARKLSIRVTPDLVEAVAPVGVPESKLIEFVQRKRKWVFHKVEELAARTSEMKFSWPERFVTGAKIPFRGRNMKLRVKGSDVPQVQVRYCNAFLVEKPKGASDTDVRAALEKWLKFRLIDDVLDLVHYHAPRMRVRPGRIRVSKLKTRWGSCGKNGDILINWLLVIAPKPVLEYVVVHELCHLKQRNHSENFWALVGSIIPDYMIRKKWLVVNGRYMGL